MKKNFILFFLMFFCVTVFGQNVTGTSQNLNIPDEEICNVIDIPASFPGGQAAMMQWLSDNMNYPTSSAEKSVQGRVIVEFVVTKTGQIANVKVARGVDPLLDHEAVRLVKSMPKWAPGMKGDEYVNTRYTLPVTFRFD